MAFGLPGMMSWGTPPKKSSARDVDETRSAIVWRALFQAAAGIELEVEVLSRGGWTAGHSLVAEHFQRGRVFLGGDAEQHMRDTLHAGPGKRLRGAKDRALIRRRFAATRTSQCHRSGL